MRPDRLICCDCVEGMRALPPASIPLTVTSPPYDDLRDYGGHLWDFEKFMLVAQELRRLTMPGGVVVWVVQDKIDKGSESGTSSRHRIYFQRLGFDLHGTIILSSKGIRLPQERRYVNQFQYAFVLSKGRPARSTSSWTGPTRRRASGRGSAGGRRTEAVNVSCTTTRPSRSAPVATSGPTPWAALTRRGTGTPATIRP